jgi:hypothetical protein
VLGRLFEERYLPLGLLECNNLGASVGRSHQLVRRPKLSHGAALAKSLSPLVRQSKKFGTVRQYVALQADRPGQPLVMLHTLAPDASAGDWLEAWNKHSPDYRRRRIVRARRLSSAGCWHR